MHNVVVIRNLIEEVIHLPQGQAFRFGLASARTDCLCVAHVLNQSLPYSKTLGRIRGKAASNVIEQVVGKIDQSRRDQRCRAQAN